MKLPNFLFLVFSPFCLCACHSVEEQEDGPLVLAAASLQEALEASADAWQDSGNARPVLSFAATSALARQIEAGAPADLFVSADERWMDHLEAKGELAKGTRHHLAGNRIALIAPAGTEEAIRWAPGEPLLGQPGNVRLAMADPDAVPAGRYGKQALLALGLWDGVANRLAIGENVRVALRLVSRNEAALGIVYRTDALADDKVRIVALFPEDSHRRISYPIARLMRSSSADAEGFEAFLLSEKGRAIFRRYGFEAD